MNLKAETEELLKRYFDWLKDKTLLKTINSEWMEVTTPYLDRHNDCLQIYLRKEGANFLLTDDSYILNDLTSSGCDFTSRQRKELLITVLNSFGVQLDEKTNQLTIHSSIQDFPLKQHSLIQAMLAVNDLFYLARSQLKSLFLEDVKLWLDSSHVRYISTISFFGKTGFNHRFDFAIPKSERFPERLIQAINNPNKQSVQNAVFKCLDMKEIRPDSELITVVNDSSKAISSNITEAFQSYDMKTVLWSEKEKSLDIFVA